MSFLAAARVSHVPMVALGSIGIFWGAFSALVPDIKAAAGASDAGFGTALIFSAAGGMAAMAFAPRIGRAMGAWLLPVAGLIVALAAVLPALASSVLVLGAVMAVLGGSVSLLDISANVRITELESRHKMHLMNLNHAMFSFAFGGAAFATSLARQAGLGPAQVLPVVGVVLVLAAAAMRERAAIRPVTADGTPEPGKSGLPWAAILPAAVILFASFICENATEAWSALHIERTLGGAHGEGGFGPTMLGLTMGLGRMAGQIAAQRLGEARLVMGSAVLGIIGALLIAAAPAPWAAMAGVAVLGLGVAVVVPSANSLLGHSVRADQRGIAISRAWMIGFTGFFIGPSAMGLIAETGGLRVAFLCVAAMMAVIIPAVVLLSRRQVAASQL